jgi:hypothetical protein
MSITNLTDRPVEQFDEEEPLGLSRYASALTDFIRDCETPITIGIQGDWGVGKTSLLNMVRDQLGEEEWRNRIYPTIYFNTWQYAQLDQEDHLTVAMLHDIVERIDELNSASPSAKEKAGELLKDVGSIAANLGSQMVENKVGANPKKAVEESGVGGETTPPFLQVMNMMVDYKQQFRNLVQAFFSEEEKQAGSRLVIMIDDLDRIRPARALDLLSSVKNFLDVPYCVFVLAVDYSVIQRGVEEKLGTDERKQHGKSYFDKIIQVPFNMPVSSYQVDRYSMSLLGWKWDEENEKYRADRDNHNDDLFFKSHKTIKEDKAKEIENLLRSTVGQNPRSIKRAVNYYGLLKRVFDKNGGPEEAKDRRIPTDRKWRSLYLELLFGFSCFQLSYPELFDYFLRDPTPQRLHKLQDLDHLGSLNAIDKIANRVEDIEDVKSDISAFFDQLVVILDASEDEEWQVTGEEFQPVWDVIRFTNLAGGTSSDIWEQIRNMVEGHAEEAGVGDERLREMNEALSLLEHSEWNNPLHIEAKDSGTHSFNLFWDGEVVGSITSTQEEPLQFYVEPESPVDLSESLNEGALDYIQEVGSSGHYGHGSLRVHLRRLLEPKREQGQRILKEINQVVVG